MGKIRFRARKGTGFKLPPEGTHELQIVHVDGSKTSREGDQQVVVQFAIADGPHEGEKFRQYYTLNEERGWVFRALCEAAGLVVENVNEDEDDEVGEYDLDIDDLNERYLRARVEINEGKNGKKFVNLRDEEPSKLQQAADADDPEPADEDGAASGNSGGAEEPPPRRRRPPPAS